MSQLLFERRTHAPNCSGAWAFALAAARFRFFGGTIVPSELGSRRGGVRDFIYRGLKRRVRLPSESVEATSPSDELKQYRSDSFSLSQAVGS